MLVCLLAVRITKQNDATCTEIVASELITSNKFDYVINNCNKYNSMVS